MEINKLRMLRK